MRFTPDELASIAEDEAVQAARQARREASRDARARAQAELDAALVAPLVPGAPAHDLERIAALRPKVRNDDEPVPATGELEA